MSQSEKYQLNNEQALFSSIASGDEEAYTQIFHLYTPKLFAFMQKITHDEHLAKELLQETFLKLWIKRAELVNISNPGGWLYRVASNICLMHLRTVATHNRLQPVVQERHAGEAPLNASEILERKEMQTMFRKAIATLPEKRKEIYKLSREQGLSHREIADQLNLSVSTVKNQLGASVRTIQEYINRETGLSIAIIALLFF